MPFLADFTLMKKDVGSNLLDFIYWANALEARKVAAEESAMSLSGVFIGGGTKVDSERA